MQAHVARHERHAAPQAGRKLADNTGPPVEIRVRISVPLQRVALGNNRTVIPAALRPCKRQPGPNKL